MTTAADGMGAAATGAAGTGTTAAGTTSAAAPTASGTMLATPAPALPPYECTVLDEWIDYNGHMSEAFYVLVFGYATDAVMDILGMDATYRKEAGASLYTVEAHVRYLAETGAGAPLTVKTTIAGSAAKKLHLAHEMYSDGTLIATEELLALHVDSTTGRTSPLPEQVAAAIEKYSPAGGQSSARAEPPDWVGRSVSL